MLRLPSSAVTLVGAALCFGYEPRLGPRQPRWASSLSLLTYLV